MKKSLLSCSVIMGLVLGACVSVAEANTAPGALNQVTASTVSVIPDATPGFAASITGLYLQPSATNLTYAIYTTPLPLPAPNWSQATLNPSYSAAFRMGLQYTAADLADQVRLDWLHVDTSDSTSMGSNGVGTSVAPPYYFGPDAQELVNSAASNTTKFKVDNVNLDLSHTINLSSHIQIQPFFGISVAYLKEGLDTTFTGQDGNGYDYSITTNFNSTFTGVGPRLGFDGTYFVTHYFGVTAQMAASLLAGSMDSQSTFYSYDANPLGNSNGVTTTLADQSQTKLVPEIDSRVGVTYAIPFNAGGSLTIQAGYLFTAYVNGINQVVPTSLVPNAFNDGTIAIETEGQQQSDLDLNGPYLNLVWKF